MTKLIAIDDGHGMETSGKRTPVFADGTKSPETGKNFMHENEFNRAVAKYLKADLERSGFKTIMVAPTDADTPLSTRVATANNAKADFYISIHANANTGKWGTWGGAETLTYPSGQSLIIGKIIHKHMMKGTPIRDRGVKNGDWLYVVKNTKMPAVLVECGFMDNLQEAKLLLSDAFRRETAREIAMGICEGFGVKYVSATATQPKPATPTQPSGTIYRVRLHWSDAKTQKGAFSNLANAKELAESLKNQGDYRVFDEKGNVVYDPTPEKQDDIWYRVRKTWADSESQIGAFHELDGAKELADSKAKEGYKVFDESGKVVYTPKVVEEAPKVEPTPAPKPPVVEPKPEPKPVEPTPQPEPTPAPVDPHKGHTDICGKSVVDAKKMVAFVKAKNPNVQDIEAIANAFITVGEKYGIRGDIAFCQSIIETGWFKFDEGTAVTPDQHNYCGLGVTSKGIKGCEFTTVEDGVTAQIQHLFAYACKEVVPNGEFVIDPRFKYVTRGIAPHWEDLSNRWAMNANYGIHILELYKQLVNFEYVPVEEPIEEAPAPVEEAPVETPEQSEDEQIEKQLSMWKKIVDYVFAKIAEMFGKK